MIPRSVPVLSSAISYLALAVLYGRFVVPVFLIYRNIVKHASSLKAASTAMTTATTMTTTTSMNNTTTTTTTTIPLASPMSRQYQMIKPSGIGDDGPGILQSQPQQQQQQQQKQRQKEEKRQEQEKEKEKEKEEGDEKESEIAALKKKGSSRVYLKAQTDHNNDGLVYPSMTKSKSALMSNLSRAAKEKSASHRISGYPNRMHVKGKHKHGKRHDNMELLLSPLSKSINSHSLRSYLFIFVSFFLKKKKKKSLQTLKDGVCTEQIGDDSNEAQSPGSADNDYDDDDDDDDKEEVEEDGGNNNEEEEEEEEEEEDPTQRSDSLSYMRSHTGHTEYLTRAEQAESGHVEQPLFPVVPKSCCLWLCCDDTLEEAMADELAQARQKNKGKDNNNNNNNNNSNGDGDDESADPHAITSLNSSSSTPLVRSLPLAFHGRMTQSHLQSMKRMSFLGLIILVLFIARALILLLIALGYETYTAYVSTFVSYHLAFEYFPLIAMMIMYHRGVLQLFKKWKTHVNHHNKLEKEKNTLMKFGQHKLFSITNTIMGNPKTSKKEEKHKYNIIITFKIFMFQESYQLVHFF
ncbi:cell division cycle 2-like 2 isoform 2 [Reticulomyxa filosa]|uniref:Cell division cycle 2-like 2 isoform 2 n=1 Tax=Reticulomyxa filosa TaxID=46433 RepID=X6MGH3_RETFI|nr:cell division cycle 2-like 2 isoform 2 [Reticulomyxa filosa]|eukprot:ETO12150.1 cell division cycle 2-like 2 isoform 2 [Reticulomyxa filosa]